MLNSDLETWLKVNRLDYTTIDPHRFIINGEYYFHVEGQEDGSEIVDSNFHLVFSKHDVERINETEDIDYFVFRFGTRWYYTKDDEKITLNELRYIGQEVGVGETVAMLGVRGKFELTNGSRSYEDWCKKAVFCRMSSLGICEQNTLAGTLEFQNTCAKYNINSVIGETVVVKGQDDIQYPIKLYVESKEGWVNLLQINSYINVHNEDRFITENQLINHTDGLICVLTPQCDLSSKFPNYDTMFKNLYFQIDVCQWDSQQRDLEWLQSIQNYISAFRGRLKPILIADSFYLEKEHSGIKKELNAIGKISFQNQSSDQHFKTSTELFDQLLSLVDPSDDEEASQLILSAVDNANEIGRIQFRIETGKLHLPEYPLTQIEKEKYGDKYNLLWGLLEEALIKKEINSPEYLDRLEQEMKVISEAKLEDYFLITWDILNWCRIHNIMTGYGRGSAAGSLVAYLLSIVHIDPLKYNLLFERFLNEGRLFKYKKVKGYKCYRKLTNEKWEQQDEPDESYRQKGVIWEEAEIEIKVTGSMPDIDNDIAGSKRDDVKRYIEQRYGVDCVSGIGTYSAMKIKSAIKDLGKRTGLQAGTLEYITAAIEEDDLSYDGLFKYALSKSPTIKSFIENNPETIEKIPLILNQPKTASSHAGGVVIVPKQEGGIFCQLPVKKIDGILITEWEMTFVEQSGFLKLDILGLKQLDKFQEIVDLIKANKGIEIDFDKIPLDDKKVFHYFSNGFNEDVFQFGGAGLKGFTKDLVPEKIEDLIATSALYRPGPIDMKAHSEYVRRKNGGRVVYPFGTEQILKETYGLLCYQEQVMKIVQHLASFTLNEADDIRKAIGKKLPELMKKYQERFIQGAVKNGCSEREAKSIWEDIEGFGSYSFNKSHATCYSIMGYFSQWLKVHYPLEFWLVSLKYANTNEKITSRLSEMSLIGEREIGGPDINHSTDSFTTDGSKIFWSLQSIKQVGEKALADILEERKNGEFYSITEFATRMKKTSVNKAIIVNLILTGAFDNMYDIESKTIRLRLKILKEYFSFISIEDPLLQQASEWMNYHWVLKQRELCGLGIIDIRALLPIVDIKEQRGKVNYTYYSIAEALAKEAESFTKRGPIIGGIIIKVEEKTSKKKPGDPFCIIEISDGIAVISGVLWSEEYKKHKADLNVNDIIFLKDVWIRYDDRYKKCNTFTITQDTKLKILKK